MQAASQARRADPVSRGDASHRGHAQRRARRASPGPCAHELDLQSELAFDAVVVGSGASGLAAAITARLQGLDVLVVEKDALIGGCTAYSFGTVWMPCNPAMQRAGIADDRDAATTYLRDQMGTRFDAARVQAYLDVGPEMVRYFETHAGFRFRCREDFPDYLSERPGAAPSGRTMFVEPFDAHRLGADLARLRAPLPKQTVFGMMYSPDEVETLRTSLRSPRAFAYTAFRLLKHARDVALNGRAMHLTNGCALVAHLLATANRLRIPILTSSTVRRLVSAEGRVAGVAVASGDGEFTVKARRGVILACGGFGRDLARCTELFANAPLRNENWSLAPPGNSGDGLRLGQSMGARLDRDLVTPAFWAPVSRGAAGSDALYGHFQDRQRPGVIAVTRGGRRFTNEAASNHHFAQAIADGDGVAWLVLDHRAIRRYGCGEAVLPWPFPLGRHVRSGYLKVAPSIAELAQRIGIDAIALEATVARFNAGARNGRDTEFGRGETLYDRYFGERKHLPNGCVGALETAPFYAVEITAGHMGTLSGLATDLHGRALDADGQPLDGLYAVGNDAANVFGGACPGGGITLGPGMTWGFIIGHHLAGKDLVRPTPQPASAACF